MEGKWIYLLLLLAYYLYSAYTANKKKQEKANKEQQPAEKPEKHFNPTPTSRPMQKPIGDIFKEIFSEQFPKQQKKIEQVKPKKKQPVFKQAPKQQVTVASVEAISEGEASVAAIHADSARQTKEAYETNKVSDSYSFNPREAFISSIIFNRLEYLDKES